MVRARALVLFAASMIALSVLSAASQSQAQFQVGVSPAVVDLGTVERGTVATVKFAVFTQSNDPLLIELAAERGTTDFFMRDEYNALISEYSEEDVVPWVVFVENPFDLGPTPGQLPGGVRGAREVSFLIQVPEDAEPGYHTVRITPTPSTPSGGATSTRIVAITAITVLFKVPGDAVREGQLLDVVQGNVVGPNLEVNSYFQNTGTVTMAVRGDHEFYRNAELREKTKSSTEFVAPGERSVLKTYMFAGGAPVGDYDVVTRVSYTTGHQDKESTVSLYEAPPIPKPETIPTGGSAGLPLWAIVAIVAAVITISILIYKWYK